MQNQQRYVVFSQCLQKFSLNIFFFLFDSTFFLKNFLQVNKTMCSTLWITYPKYPKLTSHTEISKMYQRKSRRIVTRKQGRLLIKQETPNEGSGIATTTEKNYKIKQISHFKKFLKKTILLFSIKNKRNKKQKKQKNKTK